MNVHEGFARQAVELARKARTAGNHPGTVGQHASAGGDQADVLGKEVARAGTGSDVHDIGGRHPPWPSCPNGLPVLPLAVTTTVGAPGCSVAEAGSN